MHTLLASPMNAVLQQEGNQDIFYNLCNHSVAGIIKIAIKIIDDKDK